LNPQCEVRSESLGSNQLLLTAAAVEELLTTAINSFCHADAAELLASTEGIWGLLAEFRVKREETGSQGWNIEARQRLVSICSRIRSQCLLLKTLLRKYDRILRLQQNLIRGFEPDSFELVLSPSHWY
jgi:hypothetical protein